MHKRLPGIILSFALLVVTVPFTSFAFRYASATTLTEAKQEYAYVVLDSMEAEYHPDNKVVVVKGSIKNISKIVLRGHISLHILSSSGTVLYTTEMPIKGYQPIQHGETVKFDTVLNVASIKGAKQISADFTWD